MDGLTFQIVLQDGTAYTVTRDKAEFGSGPERPIAILRQTDKPEVAKVMQACSHIFDVMRNADPQLTADGIIAMQSEGLRRAARRHNRGGEFITAW